jgi:tetrahydromethanopterin S-methyltransferase subunit G
MLKQNKVTTKYITSKDLAEQTKIILGAIDDRFNKVDDRFDKIETRIDNLEIELKSDINNVQTLIDGYVKAQEDFKQEFVIMKEEIKQIKLVFKEKLGVEIRAF